MNLLVPPPTEQASSSSVAIRWRTWSAIARAEPNRRIDPVTSRNASSRASGSMSGVTLPKISWT